MRIFRAEQRLCLQFTHRIQGFSPNTIADPRIPRLGGKEMVLHLGPESPRWTDARALRTKAGKSNASIHANKYVRADFCPEIDDERDLPVPFPSWPSLLPPQHFAAPETIAHVW